MVRHGVSIITSRNIEVLTETEESFRYGIQDITSRKGFIEILYFFEEFVVEVMKRGGGN